MAWLRIDDGFNFHPKVVQLSTQERWTWLELLLYCARYKTHGDIPASVQEVVRKATPRFLKKCADVGLLDVDESDLFRVHDWDDYNGKDAKVLVRERVAKHRARNADVTADVTDNSVTSPLPKRYSRAAARARSRPVLKETPPNPPNGGEEESNQRDELFAAWLEYAQAQPDIIRPVPYAQKNAATGVWPPEIVSEKFRDPSATCVDCGEKLGHGHLENCPRMPQST